MEPLLVAPGVVALAKMGDKIQITTVATVVRYAQSLLVVIGTIVGMLVVDVLVVFVGSKLATGYQQPVHSVAAVIFLILGIVTLSG